VAQHDYIIANQSGAAFRADLNNGLAAIVSQNSGSTQPSTTYAYQWWADTTTGLLKIRNAANNAWITIGTLADTNFGLLPAAGGTMTGDLTLNAQSDLRLADSDSSNWVALQAPATVASNVTWTLPATDGTADQTLSTNGTGTIAWVDRARLVRGTAVAATSGTSIDFTGIPSWAKRITIVFDGLSLTPGAAVYPFFQLGDSGGIENTGYSSYSTVISDDIGTGIVTIDSVVSTSGFVYYWGQAASFRYGTVTFSNVDGNTWISTHVGAGAITGTAIGSTHGGGTKTLSGTLDRVRVTTTNGTDTFDNGTVNIIYEG
jgi:hypothetical protein